MNILRWLLFQTARRIASDPEVQAKAAKIYRQDVQPRAQQAWRQAGPRVRAARDQMKRDLGPAAGKIAKTKDTVMAQLRKDRTKP